MKEKCSHCGIFKELEKNTATCKSCWKKWLEKQPIREDVLGVAILRDVQKELSKKVN